MQEELSKIKNRENAIALTHHQYLSRLTLGIIIRTIRSKKLQNKIINLKTMKFKKYDLSNRDCFYLSNGKSSSFNNINKVDIVLSLLHNLRNRCYHWENILKTTQKMQHNISTHNYKNRKHAHRHTPKQNRNIPRRFAKTFWQ